MAKVLCVLYDDPVDRYPPAYARQDIPKIERYLGGQTVPVRCGVPWKKTRRPRT